ncbi:MAG: type II secretion system protein [Candidatus Rifleibacteriota bacterium]
MRGFTLVEVVIVSALILLVSLTAFKTAEIVSVREKEDRLRLSLLEMRSAMDKFHQDQLRFPLDLNELLNTAVPLKGGFYLRRLPLNPLFGTVKWEIASRTSLDGSYDHWEEITLPSQKMSDNTPIVDIRCPDAAGEGLNGILYRNW